MESGAPGGRRLRTTDGGGGQTRSRDSYCPAGWACVESGAPGDRRLGTTDGGGGVRRDHVTHTARQGGRESGAPGGRRLRTTGGGGGGVRQSPRLGWLLFTHSSSHDIQRHNSPVRYQVPSCVSCVSEPEAWRHCYFLGCNGMCNCAVSSGDCKIRTRALR